VSKEMNKYQQRVLSRVKKLNKKDYAVLQDFMETSAARVVRGVLGEELFDGMDVDQYRKGGIVKKNKGGKVDPIQSTGFVDGPPQNYAKGTTVADTENHRVRVGSFVLNAPTTERLQKEGKLPKGPQKRKAAKGGKMMDVALSKGEYVIDVDDIGKFGGYAALEKENNRGKPEVERRQAAAQGGFIGGYNSGGILRYAGPLSAVELMKSGLNVTTPTPSGFIQQRITPVYC
jgi:hypothetical protein